MSDVKQVIVMRNDLNMRKGKMVAQGAHAAMAFLLDHSATKKMITEWLDSGQTKICVRVDTLEEYQNLFNQCKEAGLTTHAIVDSGRTEFNGVPTPTCFAVGPDKASKIDRFLGHLKLL